MPSIERNRQRWGTDYRWRDDGDEWSSGWGSVDTHWHYGIGPRLHRYLPTDTILEIAPGYGRWTRYLKDHCRKLYVVDLAERCIEACRSRFAACSHIEYFVNDGKSLQMIPDNVRDGSRQLRR